MKFIDEAKITVVAGSGGKGCVSFRREKYVPRGGPNGGDGGKGGDIVFTASPHHTTLMDFRYKKLLKAAAGKNGGSKDMVGRSGVDLNVPVPIGTVVTELDSGAVLADLTRAGETVFIAKGGRGGKGNAHFTTSTFQAPLFAQDGESGETRAIKLELKMLADAALIGLPNAGKSTFLSVVSRARPKIADYPFTTLSPVLGVVSVVDLPPFVIADLPGLIEGAHEGKGLGQKFLQHSQRTRAFVHLVSVAPDEIATPWQRFQTIERELLSYDNNFKKRARLVLLTKAELVDLKTLTKILADFKRRKIAALPVSSVTRLNIEKALLKLAGMLKTRGVIASTAKHSLG